MVLLIRNLILMARGSFFMGKTISILESSEWACPTEMAKELLSNKSSLEFFKKEREKREFSKKSMAYIKVVFITT